MTQREEEIGQLVKAVGELTAQLAAERRGRGRVANAGLVALAAVLGWLGGSHATVVAEGTGAVGQIVQDMKNFNELIAGLNQMVQLAGQSMQEGTLKDAALLVARFKQDSDVMRKYMKANPNPYANMTLNCDNSLEAECYSPVVMVQAGMAKEMSFLNRSISRMSYDMSVMAGSMGSTMGRMGSWMP
ncbi:MAG: hypothetical protein HQL56_10005 [Magnetococcales bacterium]|nr:hypothetical protein [Magnetococcales bacterium]